MQMVSTLHCVLTEFRSLQQFGPCSHNYNSSELDYDTVRHNPELKLPSAVGEDIYWYSPLESNWPVSINILKVCI